MFKVCRNLSILMLKQLMDLDEIVGNSPNSCFELQNQENIYLCKVHLVNLHV